jgi:rhodanese-related sulfurtransferase
MFKRLCNAVWAVLIKRKIIVPNLPDIIETAQNDRVTARDAIGFGVSLRSARANALLPRTQHPPTTVILKAKSTAAELKSQLWWSQPALTIVDVREPELFARGHIIGAISVPFDRLEDLAKSALNRHRHIYIYGESDDQSLAAAQTLRRVGFINVTQIIGNLAAWREVAGSINTLCKS